MAETIRISELMALTPFQAADKGNLVRYLNDPLIFQNTLKIPYPYTEADADWWLEHVAELRNQHGATTNWALRHREEGVIGSIGCFLHTGLDGHRDEIGYWLAEPFRGQGAMTKVVQVFCDAMFLERPELVRIEAKVHSYNPASARVLEKAGFEREGFARKHTMKNGKLIDVILMARIR